MTAGTVGSLLVRLLEEYGVRHVFGVPGGQTFALYQAILNRANGPDAVQHVLLRDERSCAFAADSYARVSMTTGVCDATVGPGATNLVSGLGEAYSSSIPMLAIVSDINRGWGHLRHRATALQALENPGDIFSTVSKWRCRIDTPDAAESAIDMAFHVANVGRPGPVVVEIPEDVFLSEVETTPGLFSRPSHSPWYRCAPNPEDVARAAERIARASYPVVVAGGGALLSGAHEEIRQLTTLARCPVVTTFSGRGVVEDDYRWSAGAIGLMGDPAANELLRRADVVLFIGMKRGQFSTMNWTLPTEKATVLQIDIDPETFDRSDGAIALWSDAALGVRALINHLTGIQDGFPLSLWDSDEIQLLRSQRRSRIQRDARATGLVRPQDVFELLNSALLPEDIVVCDASLVSGWGATLYDIRRSGRTLLTPRGLAGLGWGLPAAIGASLADPSRRVVCLAGDGAWGFSLGEVESLVRLELPVLSLVLNNSVLGWSKHGQERRMDGRSQSTRFAEVDYAQSARGLGAHGSSVETLPRLREAVRAWDRAPVPTVLNIVSDDVETPVLT
ncbi:MAG: thiamine pyrophosphate-binding protein [Actinomycetota bacterium]